MARCRPALPLSLDDKRFMKSPVSLAFALAVILAALHASALAYFNRPINAPDIAGRIHGFAYEIYGRGQEPGGAETDEATIARDLAVIGKHADEIRTYSATGMHELVPLLAARNDLKVTLGIWIGRDAEGNRREIEAGIEAARENMNVTRILVGNEAVLRGDATTAEITALMREVKRRTGKPVSTAEPWGTWLEHPGLTEAADFLAVHVLPFWEGATNAGAADHAINAIRSVQATYPHKKIVVTEAGWPSDGRRSWMGTPDLATEAAFVRRVVDFGQRAKIEIFLMEATDQPWKYRIEGTVGPYWGVFDADRALKFALSGPIVPNPDWPLRAIAVAALTLGAGLWLGRRSPHRGGGIALALAASYAVAAGAVEIIARTAGQYFTLPGLAMWITVIVTMAVLAIIVACNISELAGIFGRRRRKDESAAVPSFTPIVSIHLPIHAEPPAVVIDTLNSLARLDYPDFEVLVVDNNTADEQLWRPVEARCAVLNEISGRSIFRFLHRDKVAGFKAGALNIALAECRNDAELIAVLDADYVVRPDWLRRKAALFADKHVGLVQSPQDHRDSAGSLFKRAIGAEYAGFFHIGMVQRNEDNAIIQHGTMCLIRRSALAALGGWSTWCITEDAELGLRLQEAGWTTIYAPESYGQGLSPDNFSDYCGQRHRWAYGGARILARHWRKMLPGSALCARQRFAYLAGWGPWLGDGLGYLATLVSIVWTVLFLAFTDYIELPPMTAMLPIITALAVRLASQLVLYRLRVPVPLRDALLSSIAGLALAPTVGRAVIRAAIGLHQPFRRTPKDGSRFAVARALQAVRGDAATALALLGLSTSVAALRGFDPSAVMWSFTLTVQAVPFLAAVTMAIFSGLADRSRRDQGAVVAAQATI